NAAALLATINVLRGRRIDRWRPTARRETSPASGRPPGRPGILIASLQQGGAEGASLGLLDALLAAGVEAHLMTIDRNREMALPGDATRAAMLSRRVIGLSGSDIRWGTPTKT